MKVATCKDMDMRFQLRLAFPQKIYKSQKIIDNHESRDIDEETTGWNFADWAYDKKQVQMIDVRTMNIKPMVLCLVKSAERYTTIKY